jgi:hypothetical protein
MEKILSTISKIGEKTGFECLSSVAYNLDYERYQRTDEGHEHQAEDLFENPKLTEGKKLLKQLPIDLPSIFHYFLDGSRRTYKVGDIVFDGRKYYPLVAGQVGVAVVKKNGTKVSPINKFCKFKNVLTFPDELSPQDLPFFQKHIKEACPKIDFRLLRYKVKSSDKDLNELAIAKIMKEMMDKEVAIVQEMANDNLLTTDRMLVIDGPLRFTQKIDITQFRNVIGISKTFRPTFTIGKGRKKISVGSITKNLKFGERTTVFKTIIDEGRINEKRIGAWYLRLREPRRMSNPLQGIIKIETYAIEDLEKEKGLSTERVDNISSFILKERNVTPYGTDSRWATHLYPVYMAEKYIKSTFLSDIHFKALF